MLVAWDVYDHLVALYGRAICKSIQMGLIGQVEERVLGILFELLVGSCSESLLIDNSAGFNGIAS